ncbi:MAG: TonB-dependent receptor [Acidobacteria bacterium]|nr:TonB-dependent receptor [Acidobacteriota bacterium]
MKRIAILFLLGPAGILCGQTTGAIEGTVFDPSGSGAAGALLRITETGTKFERTLQSDGRGRYLAPGLMPGVYEIEVALEGFRGEVRAGIPLAAGRSIPIDFHLALGETYEKVVVTAETPLVSTSTSDWGGSITAQQVDALPLNGRDLFDLSSQEPGATVARSAGKTMTSGTGIHISANGARPNQNSFRLDGIYINDAISSAPASAGGRLLGVEGIQELRLVTSPFSAEYGRLAGAAFTAVSKGGTNDLHGSVYEYLRNSALDSCNFFDPAGEKIPPLRKNQFGALLGGPLRRNRLFFLGNYEGIREASSRTVHAATLTQDARNGILPGADGARIVPVTPAVAPYLNLYPLPNGREFGDGTAEFIATSPTPAREDYAAAKVDFVHSGRLRFAGRYTFDNAGTSTPDDFQVWRFRTDSRYQFIHTETQYVPSPHTIHNFRVGFSRVRNAESASLPSSVPDSLSFVKGQQLGTIVVTGLTDFGGLRARLQPRRFVLNDYQFNQDLSHIRGAHNFRLGAGFDRVRYNQVADHSATGNYRFTSIANLLQGRPATGDLMMAGSDTARGWRQNQFFAFAQDEFRASRRLTLTLGVRYEAYSTPVEVNGKIATLRDPLHDQAMTVGGPLFQNPSKDNFAPRAALAWDPTGSGKTVLRAGAGIFFDLLGSRELATAGLRTPPFFNRVYLNNPAFPDLLGAARATPPQNSLDGLEYYVNQPYAAQFQFTLERQLGSGVLARIGYSGSRGIHLPGQIGNINPTRPDVLPDGRLFFPAGAPRLNPAFVQVGFRTMRFNSHYHALLAGVQRRWGNGFRAQAKYAWTKSIDETSIAVYDDFLNGDHMPTMFDYGANRGLSAFDLRHCFTANFSYDLPNRGRSRLASALGGWQLHGIVQVQTGNPFSPTIGFDRARLLPGSGDQSQRPDFAPAPGAKIILGDPQMYFNPTVFALPPAGMYGNLGRNTLSGPGLATADLALHKMLWKREQHALNLRLEVFNALNHPNFQVPSVQQLFDSGLRMVASAGRITETSTTSRQIQIAAKWVF